MKEDQYLKQQYGHRTKAGLCCCGAVPVGFYMCIRKSDRAMAKFYSCQSCLDLETGWEHTRIQEDKAELVGQLDLML